MSENEELHEGTEEQPDPDIESIRNFIKRIARESLESEREISINNLSKLSGIKPASIRRDVEKLRKTNEKKAKEDDVSFCIENGQNMFVVRHVTPTGPIYVTYPVNFCILGRVISNNIFYLIRVDEGNLDLIDAKELARRISNAGDLRDIGTIRNYVATTIDIPDILKVPNRAGYGLDQKTLDKLYLPPEYFSEAAASAGQNFLRHFNQMVSEADCDEAIEAYKDILHAATTGIGETNAYTIAAHAFASLAYDAVKNVVDLFPPLWNKGKRTLGKTPATKYLDNIAHLPEEDIIFDAETASSAAVFAQIGSAGYIPLIIEEPRSQKGFTTFNNVAPSILVHATGRANRTRLTPDGTLREETPCFRAMVINSNEEIELFNNPEFSSRLIINDFETLGKNRDVWKAATRRFNTCWGSVLAWIGRHITDIPFEGMIDEGVFEADTIRDNIQAVLPYTSDPVKSHGRATVIIIGLNFMGCILNEEISEKLKETLYQHAYEKVSTRYAVDIILHALDGMVGRYNAWEAACNQVQEIDTKLVTLRDKLDEDEFDYKIQKIITQLEVARTSHLKTMEDENNKGMSCVITYQGKEYYLVTTGTIAALKTRMKDVPFTMQTMKQLREFLTENGLQAIAIRRRVPWLLGPDGYGKSQPVTLIPVIVNDGLLLR